MDGIKLNDIVALVREMPEKGLRKGQVGTVVDIWEPRVFEVEFADKEGKAIAFVAATQTELLWLHFTPTPT